MWAMIPRLSSMMWPSPSIILVASWLDMYIPPNKNKLTLFINLIIQIQPMLQGTGFQDVWIDVGGNRPWFPTAGTGRPYRVSA